VKVIVVGEGEDSKLGFEFFPADGKRVKPKDAETDEDSEDVEEPETALIGAVSRKALPGPKDKRDRPPRTTGTVPTVPPRKSD